MSVAYDNPTYVTVRSLFFYFYKNEWFVSINKCPAKLVKMQESNMDYSKGHVNNSVNITCCRAMLMHNSRDHIPKGGISTRGMTTNVPEGQSLNNVTVAPLQDYKSFSELKPFSLLYGLQSYRATGRIIHYLHR